VVRFLLQIADERTTSLLVRVMMDAPLVLMLKETGHRHRERQNKQQGKARIVERDMGRGRHPPTRIDD
jgi:hypothetical protein